jgi:Ulp1 family protease
MRDDFEIVSLPKVGVLKNSFFYHRFADEGYDAVKTWTAKELFDKAKLFVPINKDTTHWVSGSVSQIDLDS